MHMCCLVCMHIGYLQFGKVVIVSLLYFQIIFQKNTFNANVSAAVSITHYGEHREMLPMETPV